MYELGKQFCSCRLLLLAEEILRQVRLRDPPRVQVISRPGTCRNTLYGVIRCRTGRQPSVEERWEEEFVPSIKGTPWPPDGERAGEVNIRVDLAEAGGDRGPHPSDIDPPIIPSRMRLNSEMFNKWCFTAQCLSCSAIRTREGCPANHTERCRERNKRELDEEPEGAFKVARDRERNKRARHEERARDMRIEDPDQQHQAEEGGGIGASSFRDRFRSGPSASSVSADQISREQSGDVDMGDLGREEERLGEDDEEGREVKMVRFNVLDGENNGKSLAARNRERVKDDEWVESNTSG